MKPDLQEALEQLDYETQLNQSLKQSLHRFHLIQDLGETIARCKSTQEMVQTFLAVIPKVIPFKTAAIYLLNRKTGIYELNASQNFTLFHQELVRSHQEEGIITWVFSEKRAVVVPYLPDLKTEDAAAINGFVVAPLLSGAHQVGFVEIWQEGIQELQKEIRLGILGLLARQVAVAIENCNLYEDLQSTHLLLKKSQQQVITSEKMAAIGVLASGIAHEINNPLQVILSKIQLLRRKVEDEKIRHALDGIEKESLRISSIITSVLRNARSQHEPALSEGNIPQIIQDVVTVAHSKMALQNVEVKCLLQAKLPRVLLNTGEITQVLTNLVENARQSMKNGGILTLKTQTRGRYLLLHVEDTGSGIPEENMNRIFEPFFTTKDPNEGTGLGLFLSYQIMERHHGKITVESEIGKGTRFTLQLPISNKVTP